MLFTLLWNPLKMMQRPLRGLPALFETQQSAVNNMSKQALTVILLGSHYYQKFVQLMLNFYWLRGP